MTITLSNREVDAAIKGGPKVDRAAKIDQLQKQLDKVRLQAAEEAKVERWLKTVETAFDKLKQELGKTLTPEEYQAIDGAYIFLHSGCVDLVRQIPSATSRGEDKRFIDRVETAETMRERAALAKR